MAERVGHTFSDTGRYRPERITIVVERGKEVAKGDLVYIEHPKNGSPVVYQVTRVYSCERARSYEEALLRSGSVILDDETLSVRADAYQWGWMNDGHLRPLRYHLPPHVPVYRAGKSNIASFTKPVSDWRVFLGIDSSSRLDVELDVHSLIRQNCLICGAVGSGKTTTALSIVVRAASLTPPVRFFIVDKDGEYKGLLDRLGQGRAINVPWYSFYQPDDVSLDEFLAEFGWQRSWWTAKILACGLRVLRLAGRGLTKGSLERAVGIVTREAIGFMKNDSELQDYKVQVINAIRSSSLVPTDSVTAKDPARLLGQHRIVIMDLSQGGDGWSVKHVVVAQALRRIFKEALENRGFGCVILLEEAMYYAPEKGRFEVGTRDSRDRLLAVLREIATNGGRNGVALWIVTQRLATVSKTVITQCAMNIICHALEDVDKQRLSEIVGQEFVDLLGGLSQGEAIVKGNALRCRFPIWVRIVPDIFPTSAITIPIDRFKAMVAMEGREGLIAAGKLLEEDGGN